MRTEIQALVLAALLVLAGCSGAVQETDTTTSASSTPKTTTVQTTTTTTATTTNGPSLAHGQKIVVGLTVEAFEDRNFNPMVEDALAYWEENAEQHTGHKVNFVFEPNATNPDYEIVVTRSITTCGFDFDNDLEHGCAPLLDPETPLGSDAEIEVVGLFSYDSFVHVLKHELGHTLGLEHYDMPRNVMKPEYDAITHQENQTMLHGPTDATDRDFPWAKQNLSVYVNTENISGYAETKTLDQIGHALEYHEEGADDNLETNVSFERVDNPWDADIVIDFPETLKCGDKEAKKGYSCGSVYGKDTDDDGELEFYDEARIQMAGIPRETRGWHVGRWLAYAFGLRGEELPEVFKNADYNRRSGRWWE